MSTRPQNLVCVHIPEGPLNPNPKGCCFAPGWGPDRQRLAMKPCAIAPHGRLGMYPCHAGLACVFWGRSVGAVGGKHMGEAPTWKPTIRGPDCDLISMRPHQTTMQVEEYMLGTKCAVPACEGCMEIKPCRAPRTRPERAHARASPGRSRTTNGIKLHAAHFAKHISKCPNTVQHLHAAHVLVR